MPNIRTAMTKLAYSAHRGVIGSRPRTDGIETLPCNSWPISSTMMARDSRGKLTQQELFRPDPPEIPPAGEMGHHVPGIRYGFGPENDPADTGQNKGGPHHRRFSQQRLFVQSDQTKRAVSEAFCRHSHHEIETVQRTPDHIGPVGSMPQAANRNVTIRLKNQRLFTTRLPPIEM